ncbi:MAG TPA: hypothetical protein PL064_14030, partial [Thermogutta sp.]|nr:hypothetical protein [Thermogutta sp.]
RERVGVRASDRRNRSRKPPAIRATLTPNPSPAERARGDYGIGSKPYRCDIGPTPVRFPFGKEPCSSSNVTTGSRKIQMNLVYLMVL